MPTVASPRGRSDARFALARLRRDAHRARITARGAEAPRGSNPTVTNAMDGVTRSGVRRRRLLAVLPLLTLGATQRRAAAATKRIGFLVEGERTDQVPRYETQFVDGMRARNWIAGRDYGLFHAYTDWRRDRAGAAVRELLGQRVDVIVTFGDDETIAAAARVTQSVPIVFNLAFAPVEAGLAESYARPGRNLTGTTVFAGPDLIVKRLEYLRAVAPSATRLFWIYGSGIPVVHALNGSTFDVGRMIEQSAATLGVTVRIEVVHRPGEVAPALDAAAAWEAQAISAGGAPAFVEQARIVEVAMKARWPTIFSVAGYVEAGGLLSYGVPDDEYDALADRLVAQVERVLRGANPATMPVELPRRFELCINAKTANAIGIAIPNAVYARADRIVR